MNIDIDSLSESEALDVFYDLRAKHGWQGTIWGEADLEDMWEELRRPDINGEVTGKPWHEVRENVLNGRWLTRWFTEFLVEKGNEYLADSIFELDENGNEAL